MNKLKYSTEKVLRLLGALSKKNFLVKIAHQRPFWCISPEFVYISPSFFRSDKCQKCGWCCRSLSLDYYEHNVGNFRQKYPEEASHLKKLKLKVNDLETFFYTDYQKSKKDEHCKHLQSDKSCLIYDESPFSCRLGIIKTYFIHRRQAYLTKRKFGKDYVMHMGTVSQCVLNDFFDEQQYWKDIETLKEYKKLADSLDIDTWLDRIIQVLSNWDLKHLPGDKIPIGVNEYNKNIERCYCEI